MARIDAHASRGLPEKTPTTNSDSVTSSSWMAVNGRRRAPVSVATVRMRCRACSSAGRQIGATLVEHLAVAGPRRRHDHDSRATEVRPPAQIDVVAVEVDRRVEPGPRPRNRSARISMQADGRANTSRTASCCSWSTSPCSTNGSISPKRSTPRPTCCRTPGSSQAHQLRADDARVRPVDLFDQQPDRGRVQRHVVVQEAEEPVVALDQAQHLVRRRRRSRWCSRRPRTNAFGHTLADPVGHVAGLARQPETGSSDWRSPGRPGHRAPRRTTPPG